MLSRTGSILSAAPSLLLSSPSRSGRNAVVWPPGRAVDAGGSDEGNGFQARRRGAEKRDVGPGSDRTQAGFDQNTRAGDLACIRRFRAIAEPRLGRGSLYQHHTHPGDGCRAAGQFRPPRHPDGIGAGDLHALAGLPALRSRRSDLAQSRPLRAFQRARLDAALCDAPSHRREGGRCRDTSASGSPRSPSTTSSVSGRSAANAPAIRNIV